MLRPRGVAWCHRCTRLSSPGTDYPFTTRRRLNGAEFYLISRSVGSVGSYLRLRPAAGGGRFNYHVVCHACRPRFKPSLQRREDLCQKPVMRALWGGGAGHDLDLVQMSSLWSSVLSKSSQPTPKWWSSSSLEVSGLPCNSTGSWLEICFQKRRCVGENLQLVQVFAYHII